MKLASFRSQISLKNIHIYAKFSIRLDLAFDLDISKKKTIFNRKRKIGFEKFNIYFMGWYSLVVELKIETEKNMFVN